MCSIAGISAVASFAGQMQQTNAANAQAAQNAALARESTMYQYNTAGRKYAFDARSTGKNGYEVWLKGMANKGAGIASAGDAGIGGNSVSLDNLIAEVDQRTAFNQGKVQDKFDDMRQSYKTTVESAYQTGRNRVASMPMSEGPNPLGLAINVLGAKSSNTGTTGAAWFPDLFGEG